MICKFFKSVFKTYKEHENAIEQVAKLIPKVLCSFCGNDQTQSKNLIAGGPNFNESDNGHPVYICNKCNELVADVIKGK